MFLFFFLIATTPNQWTACSDWSGSRIRQGKHSLFPCHVELLPSKQRLGGVLLLDSAALGTRLPGVGSKMRGFFFPASAPSCHWSSLIGCPHRLISTQQQQQTSRERVYPFPLSLSLLFLLFILFFWGLLQAHKSSWSLALVPGTSVSGLVMATTLPARRLASSLTSSCSMAVLLLLDPCSWAGVHPR